MAEEKLLSNGKKRNFFAGHYPNKGCLNDCILFQKLQRLESFGTISYKSIENTNQPYLTISFYTLHHMWKSHAVKCNDPNDTKYIFKMLKWAVNGPRQTYLQNGDNNIEHPGSCEASMQQERKRLKRKSSDISNNRPKTCWLDKENQYTSTPLHISRRRFSESAAGKADSLKDLSNIVLERVPNSALRLSGGKVLTDILETPKRIQTRNNVPTNYASTLPTFDVEYSPCALVPGAMLALRGVGIPDSYFEKPRYITPRLKENFNNFNEELCLETKMVQKAENHNLKYPPYMEESTLNSNKMGDATLERMIDAILESNHKLRKTQKSQKHSQEEQNNMSPTYTPAEDPASDLNEIWDSEKARYRQKEQKFRVRLTKKSTFNEREICSPRQQENLDAGLLRRQHGLRRKRKIYQIKASVVSSAQKFLGKSVPAQAACSHSRNPRKEIDVTQSCTLLRNLSPDSGHNSSTDYDSTLEHCTDNNKSLETMKRKLSFSLNSLNEI